MESRIETIILALCIAIFPPIWAVAAPYLNINTGAVALICAGVFAANGNKNKDAIKISLGFLLGDLWSWIVIKLTNILNWNADLELYIILFVLGGLAVIIAALFSNLIYCPSWLCGWAIGLTIMAPMGNENMGTYPIQIAISMLAGVWYVGVFLNIIQRKIMKKCKGEV